MKNIYSLLIISSLFISIAFAETVTIDFRYNENEAGVAEVQYGDILKVIFNERPSTGFVWQKFSSTANGVETIMTMDEPSYEPAKTAAIGAQGVKTFTFTAIVDDGQDVYQFVNARPWEISSFMNEDGTFNEELATQNGIVSTVKNVEIIVGNGASK